MRIAYTKQPKQAWSVSAKATAVHSVPTSFLQAPSQHPDKYVHVAAFAYHRTQHIHSKQGNHCAQLRNGHHILNAPQWV